MKTVLFLALASISIAQSASAATYKGKCAKQAETAALNKWSDVPNPDPGLEFMTMSSEASAPRSEKYVVVIAIGENEETGMLKYEVTFRNLAACKDPTVVAK
ncbi:MAG: hypothetical protein ACXWR1_08715 [Bdellovibrionota bacterium]